MGMSASQARFLMLTARRSDLEYQVQQINQERMNISENMEAAANKYTEKINNTMLVYQGTDDQEYALTYDVITKPISEGGMGLYVVSDSGKILVSSKEEYDKLDEETQKKAWIDDNLTSSSFLEKNLKDGVLYIGGLDSNKNVEKYSIDGMSNVVEVSDTTDDAEAETEYNLRMTKLQRDDKMLELQVSQLESEHQAIQTEIDSIKDVINKNVESSFKTFGGS